MNSLSIKKIALYGFGAIFILFITTVGVTYFYLNQIEHLERKNDFYEKAYDSLFEFKYYTERLLSTYNLIEETDLWLTSKNSFARYFKIIQDNETVQNENFILFWNVIDDEAKKITLKLRNPLFGKQSTQERSILRRLGEGLNQNIHSDYYLALTDLKNSIDYIKQYEAFLLEELNSIKSQKQNEILNQINIIKRTAIIFVSILSILSITILYYVVNLIAKVENRLKESLAQLKNSNQEKEFLNTRLVENYDKTLYALVDMIEERDTYTGGHSQRVAKYAVLIAKEMNYSEDDQQKIYQAGILHDIGKMNIPDSILLKPGELDAVEYKLIQNHAENGYRFLKQIPMYKELAEIILYHHERFDGKGYPRMTKFDQIPLFSYILSVADAFDAMTTSRIYRTRKSIEQTLVEIKACSNSQFHPLVAEAAVKALDGVEIDTNISQVPQSLLELERVSYFYKDPISKTFNEGYLEFVLRKNCMQTEFNYVNAFLMRNFSQYNNKHGWEQGNTMLKNFANYLKGSFKDVIIFRVHGDVFIVLHKQKKVIQESFFTGLKFMKKSGIEVEHRSASLIDKEICTFEKLQEILFSKGV